MEFKDITVMTLEELKAYKKELDEMLKITTDDKLWDLICDKSYAVTSLIQDKFLYVEIGQ